TSCGSVAGFAMQVETVAIVVSRDDHIAAIPVRSIPAEFLSGHACRILCRCGLDRLPAAATSLDAAGFIFDRFVAAICFNCHLVFSVVPGLTRAGCCPLPT